ncbi:unnamed protein product, partial [marine sediment metagenome]
MHAKCSTLSDESIQNKRAILRKFVIFNKQFLKLINDEHDTR